jgi:phage terminase Nu1 subunit (DNA packaging protein)
MSEIKANRGVSTSAAAAHIGVSGPTFAKLLNAGVIERADRGVGYDLRTVRLARLRQLEALAAGRSGVDGGELLSKQRARLAGAQTDAALLKNAILSAEFVRLASVRNVLEREFAIMKEKILSTPGKSADALQPFTALDRGAIYDVLRAEAVELLEHLSESAVLTASLERARKQRDIKTGVAEEVRP